MISLGHVAASHTSSTFSSLSSSLTQPWSLMVVAAMASTAGANNLPAAHVHTLCACDVCCWCRCSCCCADNRERCRARKADYGSRSCGSQWRITSHCAGLPFNGKLLLRCCCFACTIHVDVCLFLCGRVQLHHPSPLRSKQQCSPQLHLRMRLSALPSSFP